jgi:hypothetical protein
MDPILDPTPVNETDTPKLFTSSKRNWYGRHSVGVALSLLRWQDLILHGLFC